MRGSIVKRRSHYYAVVDLSPHPDGRRQQKWLSGYATRREAEAALSAATADLHSGRYLEPSAMSLRSYLTEEWLPASAARVRPSTLVADRQLIDCHAIPHLGHLPLRDVTPVALTKLYGQLLRRGRVNGNGGLSPRTVRFLHTVLRRAFADAVRWRYLAVNPTDGAQPPSASAARAPEMRTWTSDEARRFLAVTGGRRLPRRLSPRPGLRPAPRRAPGAALARRRTGGGGAVPAGPSTARGHQLLDRLQ